jgi:hypothetical protein
MIIRWGREEIEVESVMKVTREIMMMVMNSFTKAFE